MSNVELALLLVQPMRGYSLSRSLPSCHGWSSQQLAIGLHPFICFALPPFCETMGNGRKKEGRRRTIDLFYSVLKFKIPANVLVPFFCRECTVCRRRFWSSFYPHTVRTRSGRVVNVQTEVLFLHYRTIMSQFGVAISNSLEVLKRVFSSWTRKKLHIFFACIEDTFQCIRRWKRSHFLEKTFTQSDYPNSCLRRSKWSLLP